MLRRDSLTVTLHSSWTLGCHHQITAFPWLCAYMKLAVCDSIFPRFWLPWWSRDYLGTGGRGERNLTGVSPSHTGDNARWPSPRELGTGHTLVYFKSKCFTVRSLSPTTQLQGQKLKLEHGLLSAYLRSPLSEPLLSSSQPSLNPRCLTQAWWWGGAVSRRLLPSQKSALTSWGRCMQLLQLPLPSSDKAFPEQRN